MTSTDKMNDLKAEILAIDKEIVRLLNQRADFCVELNNLRLELGEPLRDKINEIDVEEKLERIAAYTNMIHSIYPAIFKYAETLYED